MNPNLGSLPVKASIIIWACCCFCNPRDRQNDRHPAQPERGSVAASVIDSIPLPAGYHRIPVDSGSFAAWLRTLPLKKDRTVRLYNGSPREDQKTQFAVLDISVGNQDLQQCADAVMRLRAEYLYNHKAYQDIEFRTARGTRLNFGEWAAGRGAPHARPGGGYCTGRICFWDYLQTVFTYCGTLTLERQLDLLTRGQEMQAGDVFIRGGSPGHAMLVMDMAEDRSGKRIFILAQGYMPAQDIHIVKNLNNSALSPWYSVDYHNPVNTPGWVFYDGQLRRWPKKS